jgi:hypothetical protein
MCWVRRSRMAELCRAVLNVIRQNPMISTHSLDRDTASGLLCDTVSKRNMRYVVGET